VEFAPDGNRRRRAVGMHHGSCVKPRDGLTSTSIGRSRPWMVGRRMSAADRVRATRSDFRTLKAALPGDPGLASRRRHDPQKAVCPPWPDRPRHKITRRVHRTSAAYLAEAPTRDGASAGQCPGLNSRLSVALGDQWSYCARASSFQIGLRLAVSPQRAEDELFEKEDAYGRGDVAARCALR
jgi:hypothetical protein